MGFQFLLKNKVLIATILAILPFLLDCANRTISVPEVLARYAPIYTDGQPLKTTLRADKSQDEGQGRALACLKTRFFKRSCFAHPHKQKKNLGSARAEAFILTANEFLVRERAHGSLSALAKILHSSFRIRIEKYPIA